MTRTEDRLTDALAAAARTIPEGALRPLTVPERPPRRWAHYLAPVGAAAGVAVAVSLALVLSQLGGPGTGAGRQPHSGPAPLPPSAAGPPRYYVAIVGGRFCVRDTGTGQITATIPNPEPPTSPPRAVAASPPAQPAPSGTPAPEAASPQVVPWTVAAGRDGTFAVAYQWQPGPSAWSQTWLYSFRLTATGQVTGFTPVAGGVIDGLLGGPRPAGAMAVSPDGSKLAFADYVATARASATRIVVIDLRTGEHRTWQGGLPPQQPAGLPPGQRAGRSIDSISWAAGGRSLVFMADWCQAFYMEGCTVPARRTQVRTLDLAAGGGLLTQGRVLLQQSPKYPWMAQAVLTPGGASITVAVLGGNPVTPAGAPLPEPLSVVQIPLAGGAPQLLYHGRFTGTELSLSPDPSGHYWLLAGGSPAGWIHGGRLHLLPQGSPAGYAAAEAW